MREPKVSVRILHRCNFRCPTCSTFSGPERRGMMTLADFRRAVEILSDEGFSGQLNISGGETSLHPGLESMLALAAQALPEASVCVFTNGHWVGLPGWEDRLDALLAGSNVLVRFSLDRPHAMGEVRSRGEPLDADRVRAVEIEQMARARRFVEACRERERDREIRYDVAFKGTLEEARAYTRPLGDVPLYLIRFRTEPERRPKEYGFLAVDVDERDRVAVYPTLGHIPTGEPLGGLSTLARALRLNREARGRIG